MEEPAQFETFVRAALAERGIAVDDVDIAVITAVEAVYGPGRGALLDADLSDIVPEHDFNPGRAPADLDPHRNGGR